MPPQSSPPQPPKRKMRGRTWAIIIAIVLVLGVIGAISNAGNPNTGTSTNTTPQAANTQASQAQATPTATPKPKPQFAHFGDGMFVVGKDIQPGTYRTREGSSNCYYARLRGFGGSISDIIANENTDDPAIVTIARGDKGFESRNCGTWTKDLSRITSSKTSFGDGTYFVGTDIEPGTYKSSGQPNCYYARLRGFGGNTDDIISNENTDTAAIVTIAPGDKGFSSTRCGTWKKI